MRGWKLVVVGMGCFGVVLVACACLVATGLVWVSLTPGGERALKSLSTPPSANRLVVLGDDGNIYTVSPDGSDRQALTTDATTDHTYRQPTWSPSAERVAWVEIDSRTSDIRSTLLTSRSDGRDRTTAVIPFPAFYLFWSPDSQRLAYLSSGTTELALSLVDVAHGGDEATTLDRGQPLYFSWAPDGRRLLTHIGTDRLALLSLDGTQAPLDARPAAFAAPQWSPDGSQLLYAVRDGTAQRLIAATPEGTLQHEITSFDGVISFTMSPDRRQIAYAITPEPIGTAAFGPLYIADLNTNQARELSAEPVLAFFWSPDSRYVIFLRPERHPPVTPVPEAAPLRQEQLWLRWHIWDGTRTFPLSLFSPSDTFLLDYLRFFDQYAQSMTLWAPDSSAFVYAGLSENGFQGVWVHPIGEGSAPTRVTRGLFAAWSPR
ncbi:MAG: hypothetical protein M5U01_18745 [Ardenticatenaceae bacterium]|nr:hypothetical protein [Ardenticatenaceae bacterium]